MDKKTVEDVVTAATVVTIGVVGSTMSASEMTNSMKTLGAGSMAIGAAVIAAAPKVVSSIASSVFSIFD